LGIENNAPSTQENYMTKSANANLQKEKSSKKDEFVSIKILILAIF
jgi:hypothetical protein